MLCNLALRNQKLVQQPPSINGRQVQAAAICIVILIMHDTNCDSLIFPKHYRWGEPYALS